MDLTRRRLQMKIKHLRTARGLTQVALAKKVGVSREYVARLETGHHDPPLSTLTKLAKALGVGVEKLLT